MKVEESTDLRSRKVNTGGCGKYRFKVEESKY